ncbi:MAG: hypothetical protein JSR48_13215 [Verrucomicrobia bacterium]|nr:hypothetical protein [Verrucomicrobiota bacterium]
MTNEEAGLAKACERLGASPAQAITMAAQLLKRAGQLATERGITREEALAHLLKVVVSGRQGEAPMNLVPPNRDADRG